MTVPLLLIVIAAALRPTIAETTTETLRQTSSCGHAGYLTQDNGVIDSHPGFTTNQIYSNDLNCTWTIQAPAGKAVQLSAKSFDLESHSPCNYDYLEVFDGDGVSGRNLGMFCGSSMSTVTSRQNFLTLYFHTDDSVQQKGFRLQYTFVRQTSSCGHAGYLTQDNGVIDSHPGFATHQNYSNDLDCRWTIQAPAGKAVQLSAKSFDLESSTSCIYDYLEVFDGHGVSIGSLGKFCGSSMSTVTSIQNFLTLHFHTDDSEQQKGFRLQYTFVNASALLQISSCGYAGYMTQNNGVIDSHPGFATNQDYPNDMNCTWTIQAPAGKAVQLSAKSIDLESASSVCYDALEVFDGDLSGRSLGKFCGSNMSTVTSRQNFLTLHFHTDASVQRKGFRLQYTFVNASAPTDTGNMPFTECPGHWTPWHGNTASRVSWVTTSRNEVIAFTVTARITHAQWLGLGLSRDNKMSASDVYIAHWAGDRWVVEDRYASGYTTPAVDVHQDVTYVTSHEDNGVLTVTFRRRLHTGDRDDMNVTGCLYLLFAYGAADHDSIHYHANTKVVSPNQFCFTNCGGGPRPTQMETTEPDTTTQWQGGGPRPTQMETTEPDTTTQWQASTATDTGKPTPSQPRNMPFTECPGQWIPWHGNTSYRVSWVTTSRNEVIAFTVTARITHSQWLGLGLSRNNQMSASDVYIAHWAGDRWVVEDRYASGYSTPAVDVHQDVTHVTSHEDNGVLTVTFRRRLHTGDRDDMNVTGCLYLLFAYGAADNDSIHYHSQNKVVSPNQFCFKNCDEIHVEGTMNSGCTARAWNVTLDMRRLWQIYPGAKADDIYMGESSCTGVVHGGILTFNRGFVGCLTDKRVTGPSIVYLNELVYAVHDTVRPYIIRGYRWTVPVQCDVYNNGSTSGHIPTDDSSSKHLYTTTNSSDYTVQLSFYQDLNYVQSIPGNPLHVGVGTFVYVKVYTPSVDWGVTMRVHTCYTKPMATSANITNYYLIKNGCEVDTNTHISSQTAHETRFQFQNFESTAVGAGMFILCDATFCGSADTSRHCTETCNPGAK